MLTGIGLVWYFESEKERMKRKRIAEATKGVGKPKVGGPFSLIDQNGNTVTHEDLKGRYALVRARYAISLPAGHWYTHADRSERFTLASLTAQISVLMNWIKWHGCSTWSRNSAPIP